MGDIHNYTFKIFHCIISFSIPATKVIKNKLYFIKINFKLKTDIIEFWSKVIFFFKWDHFSSVQSLSRVRLFATPWTAVRQASLSITNSQSLLKLKSITSVMPSNHLILCRPLLLPPSIFPSIRVFSNESVLCIRWPKYWSFSFSIIPSNEYSGLISFRIDWLDLLAVQGTLKSLLQYHSSKASILWCSVFFIVLNIFLQRIYENTILYCDPRNHFKLIGNVLSITNFHFKERETINWFKTIL